MFTLCDALRRTVRRDEITRSGDEIIQTVKKRSYFDNTIDINCCWVIYFLLTRTRCRFINILSTLCTHVRTTHNIMIMLKLNFFFFYDSVEIKYVILSSRCRYIVCTVFFTLQRIKNVIIEKLNCADFKNKRRNFNAIFIVTIFCKHIIIKKWHFWFFTHPIKIYFYFYLILKNT